MLSIPVKKSENLQLSQYILEYCERTQGSSTSSKLLPFLSALDNHRSSFTTSTSSTTLEFLQSSLELYLSGLTSLESRIPISSTNLRFQWFDSYTSSIQQISTYNNEKTAVMYTLASLYSQSGSKADLKSSNGHKIALNAFQIAAGYLKSCKEQCSPSQFQDDLHVNNFAIWEEIMVGQGYYTMFHKIDKRGANKENIVKLAHAIFRNFESALGKTAEIKEFPGYVKDILKFWTVCFEALTELYQGVVEKEKISNTGKGFGAAIARIRMAERIIEGLEYCRNLPSDLVDMGKEFVNLIKDERSKAEDENYAVYMDSIPEIVQRTRIEVLNLFQAKKLEPKRFQEQELLSNLLPLELQVLYQEYDTKTTESLKNYQNEAHIVLQSIKTLQNSTFTGIPNSLWQSISSLQHTELARQIETLQALRRSCKNELENGREKLMKEEIEDDELKRVYGKKWMRKPSCIANADLKIEIDAMNRRINEGFEVDEEIINNFFDKEKELAKLNQDKETLDSLIPNLPVSKESEKSSIFRKLQDSSNSLQASIDAYSSAIKQPSIYSQLKSYHSNGESTESILNKIHNTFHSLQQEISKNLESCKTDIKSYSNTLLPLTVENRASSSLTSLSSLISTKHSLSKQIDDRLSHYSCIFNSIQQISVSIDSLLSSRDFEKQEILGRLSSNKKNNK